MASSLTLVCLSKDRNTWNVLVFVYQGSEVLDGLRGGEEALLQVDQEAV